MIKESILVVPSYEPEGILLEILQELTNSFESIIVVNDGSGQQYDSIFQQVKSIPHVTLIEHKKNQGKGAALKTAFRFVLQNYPQATHVIMCDADGQHLPKDVINVTQESLKFPQSFIFGVRSFSYKTTPFRSWLGNTITQFLLKLALKTPLGDTQTGLRAYPTVYLQEFIKITSDRYEYDTESIILMTKNHWDIQSTPIETVYIDGNRSSHFNPIIDSIKIYWVIFRFFLISVLSFLLDISIFAIMTMLSFSTFASLCVSRPISSLFNFTAHKMITFKSQTPIFSSLVKYIVLWFANLFIATYLIDYLVIVTAYEKISIKIVVDILLFIFNFFIVKLFIFNTPKKK